MAGHMNLEKLGILDPRLDVSEGFKKWMVMLGASEISTQQYPCTQFNQTYMMFNISLPNNTNCVVDRSSCIVSTDVNIKMTTTPNGNTLAYNPLYEGLRCRALDKITSTLTFSLNGNSVAYQPYEISAAQSHCENNRDRMQIMPTQIDPTVNYDDCLFTAMSPFNKFLDNTYDTTRGSYPITIVSNTTTGCELRTTLYSNLCDWDPFSKDKDVVGINIYPFQIQYVFISKLARIWSRSNVAGYTVAGNPPVPITIPALALTNFDVSFSNPNISMTVLTLPDGLRLPPSITYPYHKLDYIPNTPNGKTFNKNTAPFTFQSGLIELETCPSKIIIFVKPSTTAVMDTNTSACTTADYFGQIQSHFYKFGNRVNLLANQTPPDIFAMSKRNGLSKEISFQQWNVVNGSTGVGSPTSSNAYLSGSIVIIDPIRDFYAQNYLPGKSEKIQFQANVMAKCYNDVAIQMDLGCLFIYDGVISQEPNMSYVMTNLIADSSEIKMSPMSYNQIKSLMGGRDNISNFFRTSFGQIKRYATPIIDFLKKHQLISKAAKMIPSATPYIGMPAQFVGNVAEKFGFGDDGDNGDDGGFIAGDDGEGVLAGGKRLSRKYLQRRLRR